MVKIEANQEAKLKCGIVMPIGAMPDCPASHWTDVQTILKGAIESAGFSPDLVSDGSDAGVIQQRIVQSLYEDAIVVCDVSCLNPNVMFELGLRLAFDKPTIIVKDEVTPYSFGAFPIEHLMYPRDLRFGKIVAFKAELAKKIQSTHAQSTTNPNYTTFLEHFGEFTDAKLDKKGEFTDGKLDKKEVTGEQTIIERLKRLESPVRSISEKGRPPRVPRMLVRMRAANFDRDKTGAISDVLIRHGVRSYVQEADNLTIDVSRMATEPLREMVADLEARGFVTA